MDDHRNTDNRTARIDGRWKKVIHTSFVLLGAAALVLRISSDDGYDLISIDDGGHGGLLRVISRRTAETNCNRFHRKPNRCNQLPGCTHNRTACVPSNMMTLQFANANADLCSKFDGLRRKCRRNACAWNRSTKKCEKPSHECDYHKGKARVCNTFDQCIYNPGNGECELMSQTSLKLNACSKSTYRQCRKNPLCLWRDRNCTLKSEAGNIQQQTATQATQAATTTTTKATTTTTKATTTTTTKATTTTVTTQAAGSTQCWEWHPLPGEQTPTCTNTGIVPEAWSNYCQHTNSVIFFKSGQECCDGYYKNAPSCTYKTKEELQQVDKTCQSWHPSPYKAKTCTNDFDVPDGWKNGCPTYNGKLFFESADDCCEKYYKGMPKKDCVVIDINNPTTTKATAAADTSCHSWHPSITSPKTCTNDGDVPNGWKNGCPNYNGQLFFETYDECCDKYHSKIPKKDCIKIDVGNMNPNSGSITTTTTKATSATTTTTKASTVTAAATPPPSPKPSPKPTKGPTAKPSPKPSPKPSSKPSPAPTAKPSHLPTPAPTKKPIPGPTPKPSSQPTKLPTVAPTPRPSKKPTLGPTHPPQVAKWYPLSNGGQKECILGGGYEPSMVFQGWTYNSETDCCKAWQLNCGERPVKWYPTSSNGKQSCVEGSDYSWSFEGNGWLFSTKQKCCEGMQLDCTPPKQKWYPTLVDGEKTCMFGEVEGVSINHFDSKGDCCAAFPEACVIATTTTTTTTTRPAVATPPCQPSGSKGCYWWPKLVDWNIECVYTSDWPVEASGELHDDHDSCHCKFQSC